MHGGVVQLSIEYRPAPVLNRIFYSRDDNDDNEGYRVESWIVDTEDRKELEIHGD